MNQHTISTQYGDVNVIVVIVNWNPGNAPQKIIEKCQFVFNDTQFEVVKRLQLDAKALEKIKIVVCQGIHETNHNIIKIKTNDFKSYEITPYYQFVEPFVKALLSAQ